MTAAALDGRRGLEDVPQGLVASLTVGGEVIESDNKLVAFVADEIVPVDVGSGFHCGFLLSFALAFVVVEDLHRKVSKQGSPGELFFLEHKKRNSVKTFFVLNHLKYLWNFFGICTVHVCLSDGANVEQLTVREDQR